MEELKSCLQALQAGKHEENIVLETIKQLNFCGPQELSEHRNLVAAVYCQLLQYCQAMYEAIVPEETVENLLSVFEGIEQICVEATEEEKKDSNLITVWFLHELKIRRESGSVSNIDDDMLSESIRVLLQELGSIYFVFEIKKNGQYVFPIHDMIAKVVENPGFVDINNPLGNYQVHILQLAVRLFKNSEDQQKILLTLIEQCNLKFINYLYSSGYIIDTPDLLNHQKNGVMIFYNKESNKILVRNKNKDYFMLPPSEKTKNLTVEEEKDYHNNKIGFFMEYDLDKKDLLMDYSEMLENESGREKFLRLVFDKQTYNILFEGSIIKCADGSFKPVNPFCFNDSFVIKGHLRDKNGKCYDKAHFLDALLRYRCSALKISSECIMNRVSFGLAVLLLQKENTGVDALRLNEFVDNKWYQSQLLKNWTESCRDSIEAIKFITDRWQCENDYCVRLSNSRKKTGEKNIEDHEIEALDFYPLKDESDWIYLTLGCENPTDWYVLHGKIQENDEDEFLLGVDLTYNMGGKRFSQDTGQTVLFVKIENVKDSEGLLSNIGGAGEEYYFLYDNNHRQGVIFEQSILKMLSAIERIQAKNQLTLETVSKINRMQYKGIVSRMRLQEAALCELSKDIFCDFDSQVYYRLIHNLLWAKINKDNINSYLRIVNNHQKLEFKDIKRDEKFMRKDANALYVPKDSRESDSVLTSIYENYLKSKSVRESNDLYDHWLNLQQNGYYHNGEYIKRIMFLCDNFESGGATIRMLKAYLNINTAEDTEGEKGKIEAAKTRCQKYYLKKDDSSNNSDALFQTKEPLEEVMLTDIIQKNACTIEIHAYYGTKKGKEKIELFLQEQVKGEAVVSYEKEIVNCASQIFDDVKRIWLGQEFRSNVYTVVREFNMTKGNVFPEAMLNDPKKAICMFVKKREISKKGL